MTAESEIIKSTFIEGVYIMKRPVITDQRGFFHEVFRQNELKSVTGMEFNMVQPNHSRSNKGVIRGIHVAPYTKIVYAIDAIQQVVVDLRKDSPTFKQYLSIEFGGNNLTALTVPPNCGNAFQALENRADYFYYVNDYWSKEKEFRVAWNDPELNIPWTINPPTMLSEQDLNQPTVAQLVASGMIK